MLLLMMLMLRVHFVCVCQGAGDSELPLTATHIYNRTENKTTAVTYKVSISIHQYRRFILSLARSLVRSGRVQARARACALELARSTRRQHYFRLIYGSGRSSKCHAGGRRGAKFCGSPITPLQTLYFPPVSRLRQEAQR